MAESKHFVESPNGVISHRGLFAVTGFRFDAAVLDNVRDATLTPWGEKLVHGRVASTATVFHLEVKGSANRAQRVLNYLGAVADMDFERASELYKAID
jgi:hypothetical protein